MGKLKDPAKVWKPANLIPTVTSGPFVHAAIVTRKTVHALCDPDGLRGYRPGCKRIWSDDILKYCEDPMGLVNCDRCFKVADGWINVAGLAPPGMQPQPNHPDRFFAALSRQIMDTASPSESRTLWLVLADYFDDIGDMRGEFIRLIEQIKQRPAFEDHWLRQVQLVNAAWRVDEQIW